MVGEFYGDENSAEICLRCLEKNEKSSPNGGKKMVILYGRIRKRSPTQQNPSFNPLW